MLQRTGQFHSKELSIPKWQCAKVEKPWSHSMKNQFCKTNREGLASIITISREFHLCVCVCMHVLICFFFLIWATEVVSSLFSLTPLSDPPMISHSRLTELQATLNSFYLYVHWFSFLWSNALSETFHLNLPPIHHYIHSPYPPLQNSVCLSPSYCTPSGICIYFLFVWDVSTFGKLQFVFQDTV